MPRLLILLIITFALAASIFAGFKLSNLYLNTTVQPTPTTQADYTNYLLQKAQKEKTVQILVSLKTIQSQDTVIATLPKGSYNLRIKYQDIPTLALEVNQDALKILFNSPDVTHIQEDLPEAPLGGGLRPL